MGFRTACIVAVGIAAIAGLSATGAADAAGKRRADAGEREVLHRIDAGGVALAFTSETGRIGAASGKAQADVGILAFLAKAAPSAGRPVTFVIGGGPGTSSAFLNLGALGPWRMDFDVTRARDSSLSINPQTWLRFTDLVFIDPPGTGFGRFAGKAASARETIWSVEGDVELLSDAIARWLESHQRASAPVVIAGQSYGGFRAPRIAARLQAQHGLRPRALVLVSPVLDYGWRYQAKTSPLAMATLLPSFAATALEAEGRFAEKELADVEAYASGAYIVDYLKGPGDVAAVERMVRRVTAITGLPAEFVRAAHGRIDDRQFVREFARAKGRVLSSYDTSVTASAPAPDPERPVPRDPFLSALRAPLSAAMQTLVQERLQARGLAFAIGSEAAFDAWDWGRDGGMPESVGALRAALSRDVALRVFVAHGYQDLQTPYFETKLILDQLNGVLAGRLVRKTYPGGHMFYSRDASRRALADDAAAFYADLLKGGVTPPPPKDAQK